MNPDGRWVERVRRAKFDLVFNLCEGIDGVAAFEPMVISVLELLGIPFTGSSSWTTALCLRKNVVNALLDRAGLPVPRWSLARRGDEFTSVGFPAICKPAAEDASIGIEQRSVVRSTRARSQSESRRCSSGWDEVLVQRYVDGREVNVGIVGDEVLPIAEIDFGRDAARDVAHRVVSLEVGSRAAMRTSVRSHLSGRSCRSCSRASSRESRVAAWSVVGGTGYGRVDFRIDARDSRGSSR